MGLAHLEQIARTAEQIGAGWVHVQYQTAAYNMNPSINLAVNKWQAHGLRVAWTYHDLLVPYLFPKAGAKLRRFVTQRPAMQANLTIVTNEGDRRQLAGIARRVVSIPIGSNIHVAEMSSADRIHTRQRLGYHDDDLIIAYFGFLNRSKGGATLVQTLAMLQKRLPQPKLLMIGERVGASDPTNYAYLQEVESLIERLHLRDSVQWTGMLSDADVSHALCAADVVFMPYEDGASLRRGTLMACLAHGCAIVTTYPTSPVPELIDGESVIYIAPNDPQAATDVILQLVGDPQLMARLQAGAMEASKQFTWEEIARQHAVLYQSLSD